MRVWMRFSSFAVICFLVYVHLGPAKWQPAPHRARLARPPLLGAAAAASDHLPELGPNERKNRQVVRQSDKRGPFASRFFDRLFDLMDESSAL